jgi:flagellar basal body-associated protein FliL
MASDNQAGGRTFLAIVLGGIVLALVIAAYFMYGTRHETSVKVDQPSASTPMAPAPMAPAPPEAAAPMAPAPMAPAEPAPAAPAAPATPPATNP